MPNGEDGVRPSHVENIPVPWKYLNGMKVAMYVFKATCGSTCPIGGKTTDGEEQTRKWALV
jgi:hypothetical protein